MYDIAATDEYNIMAMFLLQDRVTYRNTIQQRNVYSLFLRWSYQNFAVSIGRMLDLYTANIKFVVLVEIIKVCSHFKRRYQSVEALINCHQRSLYD